MSIQPANHTLVVHEPGYHDGESGYRSCMFCDGGLSACSVCMAFEGAWPDECPGVRMSPEQSDAVYAGTLNYRAGEWRTECCQVMRPIHDLDAYMAEQGYRRNDAGRWVQS
jgi:hypothetical protein